MPYRVKDWNDAYSNFAYIADADLIVARMEQAAQEFCRRHPPRTLGRGRLFLPDSPAKGLAVFIHGGYWSEPYPDLWSHLAAGPFGHGWAVAMPGYQLAPQARVADMAVELARAIADAAALVDGPLALTGHSAGGHLAARLICGDLLSPNLLARVQSCVPISPIADLRPILRTEMNKVIALDEAEAARESPIFLTPNPEIPVTCWVGGDERPEFLRQARLLADIWAGLGSQTDCVVDEGRNHMTVLQGLGDPDSALTRCLIA